MPIRWRTCDFALFDVKAAFEKGGENATHEFGRRASKERAKTIGLGSPNHSKRIAIDTHAKIVKELREGPIREVKDVAAAHLKNGLNNVTIELIENRHTHTDLPDVKE